MTLHDCLMAYFSEAALKGENKYSCEKCKKLNDGIKYSRLLSLPEVRQEQKIPFILITEY